MRCKKIAVGMFVLMVSKLEILQPTIIALHGAVATDSAIIAQELAKIDQRIAIYSFDKWCDAKDEALADEVAVSYLIQNGLLQHGHTHTKGEAADCINRLTEQQFSSLKKYVHQQFYCRKSISFLEEIKKAESAGKIVVIDSYPYAAGYDFSLAKHVFVHCSFAALVKRACYSTPKIPMYTLFMAYDNWYKIVNSDEYDPKMGVSKEVFSRAIDCVIFESLKGNPSLEALGEDVDFVSSSCDSFEHGAECVCLALDTRVLGGCYDFVVDASTGEYMECAKSIHKRLALA